MHSSAEAATTEGEAEAAATEEEEGFCRPVSRERLDFSREAERSLHISDMLCDDVRRLPLRSLSLCTRRSAALSCLFVTLPLGAGTGSAVEVAALSFSSRTILARPGLRMDSPAASSSERLELEAASRSRRSRATV